jgi:hypothetical protein
MTSLLYYVVRSVLDIGAKWNSAKQYRNKNLKKLCHCEARSNRELCLAFMNSSRLPRFARNDMTGLTCHAKERSNQIAS